MNGPMGRVIDFRKARTFKYIADRLEHLARPSELRWQRSWLLVESDRRLLLGRKNYRAPKKQVHAPKGTDCAPRALVRTKQTENKLI